MTDDLSAMICRLCVAAVIVLLMTFSVAIARTSPKMPTQFRGSWCAIDFGANDPNPQFFRRTKNCPVSEATLLIDQTVMTAAGEAYCKLLSVSALRNGAYGVKYACRSDPDNWTVNNADQWTVDETWSIDGRGRLVTRSKEAGTEGRGR